MSTPVNKAYFFNCGFDAARAGSARLPVGRFTEAEERLWWAGWYTHDAGLSRMAEDDTPRSPMTIKPKRAEKMTESTVYVIQWGGNGSWVDDTSGEYAIAALATARFDEVKGVKPKYGWRLIE